MQKSLWCGAIAATACLQLGVMSLTSASGEETPPPIPFNLDCEGAFVAGEFTHVDEGASSAPAPKRAFRSADDPADSPEQLTQELAEDGLIPEASNVTEDEQDANSSTTTVTDESGDQVVGVAFESVDGQWQAESLAWCVQ